MTFSGIFLQQALVTWHNDQYAVFYNGSQQLTVAHRILPSTNWTTRVIAGSDATVGWDSHNIISAAVDTSGDLHIAANMHANQLRYWRMNSRGKMSSIARIPKMVNTNLESLSSYPNFITLPNGSLIYNFRRGYSGDADSYFYSYNTQTLQWSRLSTKPFFDGQGARSAYYNVTQGSDGYFYVSFMWRSSGDVSTNSRLSLVRTRDFSTWSTVAGAPIALPIRFNTAGVVVDDIPEDGGLYNNQEHVGVDGAGNVAVTYAKYDASGTEQIYLARYNGVLGWQTSQLSRFSGRYTVQGINSLPTPPMTYNAASALPDGRTAVTFWCSGTQKTIVIDTLTLTPIDEPQYWSGLPSEFWTALTSYPGAINNMVYSADVQTSSVFSAMKWYSLGSNGDQARSAYPTASPLIVYDVKR